MKAFKLGSLLLSLLFILTGCSVSSAERILSADKKMTELDNYRMKMLITMAIRDVNEEQGIIVSLNSDAKVDMRNQVIYMETKTNMFGYDLKILTYTTKKENNMVIYNTVEGAKDWSKTMGTVEEVSDQSDMIGKIIELISNGTQIKDKGMEAKITHYNVTLSKEAVGKLFEISGNMSGVAQGKDYEVAGPLKVDIYINDNDYITAMNIDFTDVIVMKTADGDVKMDQFKIDFGFSEFDEIGEITVPQDIIDNAKEMVTE